VALPSNGRRRLHAVGTHRLFISAALGQRGGTESLLRRRKAVELGR
jgi:hypothetical protein